MRRPSAPTATPALTWAPVGCTPVVSGPAVRQAVEDSLGGRSARRVQLRGSRGKHERRPLHRVPGEAAAELRPAWLPGRRGQFGSKGEEGKGVRRRNGGGGWNFSSPRRTRPS